jgi:CBS domain-containing protein
MTRRVVTISPRTSVLNARRTLQLHGFRHLPVVVDGDVIGMVSDRDVRVSDTNLGRSLASLESDLLTGRYRRVETVMTTPAVTVGPDAPVAAAAQLMIDRRIGALPVVSRDGLVGIIGLSDCVRALISWAQATPCESDLEVHRDVDAVITLGPGDARPGRPPGKPVALVINPDPASRLRARNDLTALGYQVSTCPGPQGGAFCPAARDSGLPCARVPERTALVLLDPESAPLAPFYERWLPHAEIRIATEHDLVTT